jgi:DNA gyrase/topoisomerase IV subunit B
VPEVLDAWFACGGHTFDLSDEAAAEEACERLRAMLPRVAPDLHLSELRVGAATPVEGVELPPGLKEITATTLRNGEERRTRLRDRRAEVPALTALVDALSGSLPLPLTIGGLTEAPSWRRLLEQVLEGARQGYEIQRYKGLGEMNPEQLWETTMDPTARTLQHVKVDDAVGADTVFTILMGDQVEPRRDFIQQNALNVRNLDI